MKKKLQQDKRKSELEEKNKIAVVDNFNKQLTRIHTIKLLKAQEELRKREEEIRQQELLEYEKISL